MQRDPHKKYYLSEQEIRYAMYNTRTLKEAAQFLRINLVTLNSYAKVYFDKDTGLNLIEWHKKVLRGSTHSKKNNKEFIIQISKGFTDHTFNREQILKKYFYFGIMEKKCNICGFHEVRLGDESFPGLLVKKDDSDPRNYALSNVELVCFNCEFLNYGSLNGKQKR